jgi:FkbM family methyltransferase
MASFGERLRTQIPVSVKRAARLTRRALKAVAGADHWIGIEISLLKRRYGNDWADWVVAHALLTPSSVVYSFGLGRDVSFEQALIVDIGCKVFGFDPTPISMKYVRSLGDIGDFRVFPYALSTFDGMKSFGCPERGDVSFSTQDVKRGAVELPVRTLSSLMAEMGDDRIDLLKMDIEGEEYGVVEDMIAHGIVPGQLLIEFHHAWNIADLSDTRMALSKLHAAGYRIFDVSPAGREFSFIHQSRLA